MEIPSSRSQLISGRARTEPSWCLFVTKLLSPGQRSLVPGPAAAGDLLEMQIILQICRISTKVRNTGQHELARDLSVKTYYFSFLFHKNGIITRLSPCCWLSPECSEKPYTSKVCPRQWKAEASLPNSAPGDMLTRSSCGGKGGNPI